DPDALEAELDRGGEISFLYTIPTFQNPSGRTLGVDRRRRIAELVVAHELDVLEDDPYGLVRYEGVAPPSLHELEGGRRVSFTSSFSKTAAPGLRVGWFVVPDALRAAYDERAVSTYISPSLLPQAIIHELHLRGSFEPNLERIKGLLRARKDAMLAALALEMPEGVTWSTPEGGYFLWVDFGPGADAGDLLRRATEAGVTFVRGTDFFPPGGGGETAARLAFSYETPERIAEGVALLAELL
ncbi:MAG: PLP-dependent aminotransferase family protein, partial [Gaiella sp.]